MVENITKRDGSLEKWSDEKFSRWVINNTLGITGVDIDKLIEETVPQINEGAKMSDIQDMIIKLSIDKVDVDQPNWTFVSAKLLLSKWEKDVQIITKTNSLVELMQLNLKQGYYDAHLLDHIDLFELGLLINKPMARMDFLGTLTMKERYAFKDGKGNDIEVPRIVLMRVALSLAMAEKKEDKMKYVKEFYGVLANLEVMSATPTLSNAGKPIAQLSSCFKAGTKVSTSKGNIDIDKLCVGDKVLTHDNTFESVYELLSRDYTGNYNELTVSGLGMTLGATEEHPILSMVGGTVEWNPIKDIKTGDYISKSIHTGTSKVVGINMTSYISKSLYYNTSRVLESVEYNFANPIANTPVRNLVNIDKPFMKFLGYFLSIGVLSNGVEEISFTIDDREINIIYDLESVIGEVFDVPLDIIDRNNGSIILTIKNKLVATFLKTLLRTEDESVYALPPFLEEVDKDIQLGFLESVFKTSASYAGNRVVVVVNNYLDAQQMDIIALRNGLSPYVYKLDKEGVNGYAFSLPLDGKMETPFFEDVLEDIICISDSGKDTTHNYDSKWVEDENYGRRYMVAVIDNNSTEINETVYNIEVRNAHSYSVAGIDVHNCYVSKPYDSIEGINKEFNDYTILSKFGGGIGGSWGEIRSAGEDVRGVHKASGGKIPNMNIINSLSIAFDQLGTRRGAISTTVDMWDIDVIDWVDLKKNSGDERRRAHDIFPAIAIPDLFMERVREDGDWSLFKVGDVQDLHHTHTEEFEELYLKYEQDDAKIKETIKAKALWKLVLRAYFEQSGLFLMFRDTANRRNPNGHAGMIYSSNLCVTGDTRLATQFGLVKAKDLHENYGEITATYDKRIDGDLNEVGVDTAQCIKMFKTKEDADIFEVLTSNGQSIKSTDWHEYPVIRDGEVVKLKLKDMVVGDTLMTQSGEGQFGSYGSYEDGAILGLMTANGTFETTSEVDDSISAILDLSNETAYLLETVESFIERMELEYVNDTNHDDKVRISSTSLGEYLQDKYGFNKDSKLVVPDNIFKGTRETIIGYLQGIFTLDGCVVIQNTSEKIHGINIQLESTSKTFLGDIQILLSNFGVSSSISIHDKATYISKEAYILELVSGHAFNFLDKIKFLTSETSKKNRGMDILQRIKNAGLDEEIIANSKEDSFLTTITSIEYIGVEDVYDTTQELNHSLVFNGLVTMNCHEIFLNTYSGEEYVFITLRDEVVKVKSTSLVRIESEDGFETIEAKNIKRGHELLGYANGEVMFVKLEILDKETAVCNLASVNLSKINTKEDIARVVPIAIRMLDNVIDVNFYPIESAMRHNMKYRSIGLGAMGEHELIANRKIHYASQEHNDFIEELYANISYYAILASSDLAKERGSYPVYDGSTWSEGKLTVDTLPEGTPFYQGDLDYDYLRAKIKKDGMRNGNLMAVAPTSTISILVGTTSTIEAIYKRKWMEENILGMFPVTAPKISPDNFVYYKSAFDIDMVALAKTNGVRQKYYDQGISLNFFVPLNKASGKHLNDIYQMAHSSGGKSTYYLRTMSPELANVDDTIDRSQECTGCQ